MGLLDFSIVCPQAPHTGAVVVVDPFSSGANIAAMVVKWGYKLVLVFSENDNPVAALVSRYVIYVQGCCLPYLTNN